MGISTFDNVTTLLIGQLSTSLGSQRAQDLAIGQSRDPDRLLHQTQPRIT